MFDIRELRNVANHGRGASMTEMLHLAGDEIERLRNILRAPVPDQLQVRMSLGDLHILQIVPSVSLRQARCQLTAVTTIAGLMYEELRSQANKMRMGKK